MAEPVIRHRDRFLPGSYYTDGSRLLWIVSEEKYGEFRVVEDCRSLEVRRLSVDELSAVGLRPVAAHAAPREAPLFT